MATSSWFWNLDVWDSDAKSTHKATVTRVQRVYRNKQLSQPYAYDITIALSDYTAANLLRGYYFELMAATPGQTEQMWCNGYIQSLNKDVTSPGTYTLQCVSAMWQLSKMRQTGGFYAGPGIGFNNVLDLFNGVNPVSGAYPPEHKGLLTGTGWTSEWVDGINSSSPAGFGEVWQGNWDTVLNDVQAMFQHYNVYGREKPGRTNLARNGVLQFGPLGDNNTGYVIWGGQALLNTLQTYTPDGGVTHPYADLKHPNLGIAQSLGYAVITNASYQEDLGQIINICWAVASTKLENGGHNFGALAGGPPADNTGTAINGWSTYQPGGAGTRLYYTKANSQYATYNGNYFTYIATQQQNANWAYGVVDTTSVTKYGPNEYTLVVPKIKDQLLLLAAALGAVEYNSDPVASWTFKVAHPLTSASGIPNCPEPGQRLPNINYTGAVHDAIEVDTTAGPTIGQWVGSGTGAYTYMDYPNAGGDPVKLAKLQRLVQFEDEWSGGVYIQTLTLGQGKWKWKSWAEALAKKLEANLHHRENNHPWKKAVFDHIVFLLSGTPTAWESLKDSALYFKPGSTVVSDIPDMSFFSDHHSISFKITVTDPLQYVDFWFNKPLGPTLTSPNAGSTYGVFRLAFTTAPNDATNSGVNTGFYTTSDGSTYTSRGNIHGPELLDGAQRIKVGTYHFTMRWTGKRYEAVIAGPDPTTNNTDTSMAVAQAFWTDRSATSGQILNPDAIGAIGWKSHQGSAVAKITGFHAVAEHARPVKRYQHHPHTPSAHQWKNVLPQVTAWDGTNATVLIHMTTTPGYLALPDGDPARNEDGTYLIWSSDPPPITGVRRPPSPGSSATKCWIVWNGENDPINDGVNPAIPSQTFGALNLTKTGRGSWDNVYVLGCLSGAVDAHTKKPWVDGWHPGSHQAHGIHHASESIGRRATHSHGHTRHHWENMLFSGILSGGSQYFNWGPKDPTKHGYLRADNGAALHDFGASGLPFGSSFGPVPAGGVVVYNYTSSTIDVYDADGVSNHRAILATTFDYVYTSTDLTTDAAIGLVKAGHIDVTADANTGLYGMSGWHANVHVGQSQQTGKKALDATHITSRNTTGGTVLTAGNYVLAADGAGATTFTALPSDTDTALTNDNTTWQVTSAGHLKVTSSNTAPSANGDVPAGCTITSITGSDSCGSFLFTNSSGATLTAGTNIGGITFGTTYASGTPIIHLTPVSPSCDVQLYSPATTGFDVVIGGSIANGGTITVNWFAVQVA